MRLLNLELNGFKSFSQKTTLEFANPIVAIVGPNGSGKSTLLRIIAGILEPDEGKVTTNGKIISLINLNAGLREKLTMKDNIHLCCSLFGLSPREIKERFNQIVKFSGLEEFVNTKIFQFSSGMLQRLAFSIAIHCNPEILLLDEVFEVGDEKFKNKSTDEIRRLAAKKISVLLVSHSLDLVAKHCNRVITLALD